VLSAFAMLHSSFLTTVLTTFCMFISAAVSFDYLSFIVLHLLYKMNKLNWTTVCHCHVFLFHLHFARTLQNKWIDILVHSSPIYFAKCTTVNRQDSSVGRALSFGSKGPRFKSHQDRLSPSSILVNKMSSTTCGGNRESLLRTNLPNRDVCNLELYSWLKDIAKGWAPLYCGYQPYTV